MTYEEAIRQLNVMQGAYNHIRHNDSEWETLELAKEALAGKEQQWRNSEKKLKS